MSEPAFNPRILVFGVGGGGCNAVNNMIAKNLKGVEFVAANTDLQTLNTSRATIKLQLGINLTKGLGAGGDPEIGRESAREALPEIKEILKGCNMLFIATGMGGGTGTGAAPVIAKLAKELGILTIAIVTKPFVFEGKRKMNKALEGIRALKDYVGTLIIVPNQNLMRLANEQTTNKEAFVLADEVLYNGVSGISDIIAEPGLINLDLADIRSVMSEMGKAVLGTGEASGDNRAVESARRAIHNPLLENTTIRGAKQLLINITGGDDLTLFETERAIAVIAKEAGEDTEIHIGSGYKEDMADKMRVSIIATGIRYDVALNHSALQEDDVMDFDELKNSPWNPLRGNPLRGEMAAADTLAAVQAKRPYSLTGAELEQAVADSQLFEEGQDNSKGNHRTNHRIQPNIRDNLEAEQNEMLKLYQQPMASSKDFSHLDEKIDPNPPFFPETDARHHPNMQQTQDWPQNHTTNNPADGMQHAATPDIMWSAEESKSFSAIQTNPVAQKSKPNKINKSGGVKAFFNKMFGNKTSALNTEDAPEFIDLSKEPLTDEFGILPHKERLADDESGDYGRAKPLSQFSTEHSELWENDWPKTDEHIYRRKK